MGTEQPAAQVRRYEDRDTRALGQRYVAHVLAMTSEGLVAKGAIAAELAWRDWQRDCERDARQRLQVECDALQQQLAAATALLRQESGTADRLQQQLAAANERIAQMERDRQWQPMETAPKDGTEVLLDYVEQNQPRRAVGCYSPGHGWFTRPGYFWLVPDCLRGWMPLPAALQEPPRGQ